MRSIIIFAFTLGSSVLANWTGVYQGDGIGARLGNSSGPNDVGSCRPEVRLVQHKYLLYYTFSSRCKDVAGMVGQETFAVFKGKLYGPKNIVGTISAKEISVNMLDYSAQPTGTDQFSFYIGQKTKGLFHFAAQYSTHQTEKGIIRTGTYGGEFVRSKKSPGSPLLSEEDFQREFLRAIMILKKHGINADSYSNQ